MKKNPIRKKKTVNASGLPQKSPFTPDGPSGSLPEDRSQIAENFGGLFEKRSAYAGAFFTLFTTLFLWPFLTHRDWVPGNGDMGFIWPYRYVWIESLKRGYPMLWNPYSSLGQPFLANCNPQVFAPFNVLFFLLPTSYAFTWSYFSIS